MLLSSLAQLLDYVMDEYPDPTSGLRVVDYHYSRYSIGVGMDSITDPLTASASSIFSPTVNQSEVTTPSEPGRSLSPTASIPKKNYRFSTQVVTIESPDASHADQHNASSVPIYQSATFKGMGGKYDYTRSGNPTRSHLEHHIAKISGSRHAFAVTSGMGALDVIFRVLKAGDEIIAGNDLYGGSNRLLTYLGTHSGIKTHHVDTTNLEAIRPFLTKDHNVKLVLLESPTNPLLQIIDIPAICTMIHNYKREAIVVVDNTMMSPYLQRPLELGADIVYDSGTKYLSGHHDLMAGLVCCNRDDLAQQMAFVINSIGNGLSPFDSFLLLRGVKTLSIRMDRQQMNSMRIATYLDQLGFRVHYPGLPNHPGKEIHDRISKGNGAVLSFETGDKELSEKIVGGTRLWGISVSFGCVNSLISMPCLMSHASIDPAVRAARNLPEDLIRLCVGIEDVEDLIEDLEAALIEAGAVHYIEGRAGGPFLQRTEASTTVEASAMAKLSIQGRDQRELVTSAPGKVILFGEHAVVHGITAIAGSVDLRCYAYTQRREDSKIVLSLPDVNEEFGWEVDELPWDDLEFDSVEDVANHALSATVLDLLEKQLRKRDKEIKISGAIAFAYLYMHLIGREKAHGITMTIRSSLPIGAGLGSSAAFSEEAHHQGRRAIPVDQADLVNGWAFVGEKILHGNPSGVDNSVATHGGAIAFTKGIGGKPAQMEGLHGFKSIRFLLTNTKVPRDTKTLVAGVGKLKEQDPEGIKRIFDAIQNISDEARRCLLDTEMPRDEQIATLESLVDQNHGYLNDLQVSHEALEVIKQTTAAAPFNLHTKLTGAGGGGCAVTIIPDDFSDALLGRLTTQLADKGFAPYLTSVGGSGYGIQLPNGKRDAVRSEGGNEAFTLPGLERFKLARPEQLSDWAESNGKWIYV
ncbi:cystathionine beta-l [Atractiella rhizophila]|nr:cystathionine beta-l [Atractiella rhizophila]